MTALMQGPSLEKNIKILINQSVGTHAVNSVDKDGNNVLHLAASIKGTKFNKEIVKV